MSYAERALEMHRKNRGKIETRSKVPLNSQQDLSVAYTPGVAAPCLAIHENVEEAYQLTCKANSVAVVTDGSAVLGLGNIGPEAALPVMEGKALLFKQFGGIDAWPICLSTQDPEEIIETVRRIAPGFGGINLEDISAPRCFQIEERLQDLGIPVFHDDQHGTAIAVLAALFNASQVVGKPLSEMRMVVSGAGAAGVAIGQLLCGVYEGTERFAGDLILCDSKGVVSSKRPDLNPAKVAALQWSNLDDIGGGLRDALVGADVFIGVSKANLLTGEDVKTMRPKPIILGMANPVPEIMPDEAKAAGAAVVATGRSDFPNQVNNVLVFPGIFRGLLDAGARRVEKRTFVAAARAIAAVCGEPTPERVIPNVFDPGCDVAGAVAKAVVEELSLATVQ
ncbi:MAG: NADP-dependent malic enzyme [Parachlamydiales bacterium]